MLNTSASGSASPVVSTMIISGATFSMISFAAAQLGDAHVFSFDDFCVDGDLPEFIHHDGDLRRSRPQNVTEQRGLAGAEWTGHERDGGAKHVKNDEAR